jgi:hypothetical protein
MTIPDQIQITHQPRTMTTPRAALTSDDIPPGPLSEDDLRQRWNQQADEHNQWESLDSCEQLEWAQALAIKADRHAATPPAPEPGGSTEWEWKDIGDGKPVKVRRCHKCGVCPSNVDDCAHFGDSRCPYFGIDAMATPPAPEPGPTFQDAIHLAEGCHDYSGGHSGAEGEAWHGAIDTVVDVLKRAAVGAWDSQTRAVYGVGAEAQAGEVAEPEPVAELDDQQREGESGLTRQSAIHGFRSQLTEEASSRYGLTSQDAEFDAFASGASWAWATYVTAIAGGFGQAPQAGELAVPEPVAECPNCGYEGEMVPVPLAGEVEA